MIRIAAVGDLHYDRNRRPELQLRIEELAGNADLLLVAGDLTQSGTIEEARAIAEDLSLSPVPVVAVLGNHDFHSDQHQAIVSVLRDREIRVLEGDAAILHVAGYKVGVAGLKGFGGGFAGACITEFGEPETKAFAKHAREQADILKNSLESVAAADFRFALLHFAPVEATLLGEKREIYPFLGSYLLGEAIDRAGADAVFHGHAHQGSERGITPGGVPVRNVAVNVIRHAYNVYCFDHSGTPPGYDRVAG